MIYKIVCMVYRMVLRKWILEAVDYPGSQCDEAVLTILDELFNHKGKGRGDHKDKRI